jgi:hypothetical protein
MSGHLIKRVAAAEVRSGVVGKQAKVFRWQPEGLSDDALAAWHAAEVAPASDAGALVTIYSWAK